MRESHSLFDIESAIVSARNQPCPVDLIPWQDRIDKIAGKTVEGRSRLRIVWGQSADMVCCGRMAKKYPFWRYEEGGQLHDIGVPRFYVEELHSNAELQRGDGWERSRWYWDESTGEMIDVLGPIPEDGFYTAVFMVAYHDDLCCRGREVVNNDPCLGAYRPPTDSDLTRIRRMKQRRDNASNDANNPSESLLKKRAADATMTRDEIWRKNIREAIEDYTRTRSHSWATLDPAVLSHGKFHFMGAHSRSGLKPKENNASNGGSPTENGA